MIKGIPMTLIKGKAWGFVGVRGGGSEGPSFAPAGNGENTANTKAPRKLTR